MAEVATVEAAMAAAAEAVVAAVVVDTPHTAAVVGVAGRSLAAIVEGAETVRGATEEVGTMAAALVSTGMVATIVVVVTGLTEAAGVTTAVRA
jgi:hypothetical protein